MHQTEIYAIRGGEAERTLAATSVEDRTSIVSDGVVVLHYMPKAVHVRLPRILARAVSIGRILF